MYHYRRSLDERQRHVSEQFEVHADSLGQAAEIRYEQCKNMWRLTEPLNSDMATRMSSSITSFQSVCEEVSANVHTISTHRGEVFPEMSKEYLNQELTREEFKNQIMLWERNYHKIRDLGNDISRVEHDHLGTTELVVSDLSMTNLNEDLSDLDSDDECLRACLVFGEIQRERRRLLHSLFTSPARIGKEIGSTVLISIASLGASWGLVAGASMTGASFASSGVQNWRRAGLLRGPESDCRKVIVHNISHGNTIHVQDCFMRADIRATPEDIMRETMTVDVHEETVMISPYG